jgi:transketolase
MRRAFADTLTELATADPRVVFLTGDLGFQVFDDFQAKFPERYLNVGVAEAALVLAASGLALEGYRPVTYSIASFMTGRPYELARISVSYARVPVVMVGAGGGSSYANAGITHHAFDDLGLMALLPDVAVVAPGDPAEVRSLLPELLRRDGPSYMRIGAFGEPPLGGAAPAPLGRARTLREGAGVALVTTGDIAREALDAAAALAAEGIAPLVLHYHTVKPLDVAALDALGDRAHTLVVVEEHGPVGGLGAAVQAWRAGATGLAPRVVRLGVPDAPLLGAPDRKTARRRLGVDAAGIAAAVRAAWRDAAGTRP